MASRVSTAVARFDVSHLGVWLNLSSIDLTHPLEVFALLDEANRFAVTQRHRDYVAASQTKPGVHADALSLFTAPAHETRHFHDMLLTPYGSVVMWSQMAVSISYAASLGTLLSRQAIIVPLADWDVLAPLLRGLDPLIEPVPDRLCDLADIFRQNANIRRELSNPVICDDATLSTADILESSAFLTQLAYTAREFGDDQALRLEKALGSGDAPARYLAGREYLQAQLGPLPLGAMQAILLASLCGDVFSTSTSALRSPADVLHILVAWLGKAGLRINQPPKEDAVPELEAEICLLIDEFFRDTLGRSWNQLMTAAVEFDTRAVDYVEKEVETKARNIDAHHREIFEDCVTVYNDYALAARQMVATFTVEKVWYLGDSYVAALPVLPVPVTYYWSETGVPVTSDLVDRYYIEQELVAQVEKGDRRFEALRAKLGGHAFYDGAEFRIAIMLSPREDTELSTDASSGVVQLDMAAWRRYFDAAALPARLLADGIDGGMPGIVLLQTVGGFAVHGVSVYTAAGQFEMFGRIPTYEESWQWARGRRYTRGEEGSP